MDHCPFTAAFRGVRLACFRQWLCVLQWQAPGAIVKRNNSRHAQQRTLSVVLIELREQFTELVCWYAQREWLSLAADQGCIDNFSPQFHANLAKRFSANPESGQRRSPSHSPKRSIPRPPLRASIVHPNSKRGAS